MKLIFASANPHKIKELNAKAPEHIEIVSMREMGYTQEIEETGTTLEENARIKAETIFDHFKSNVFSDDSGLEVEALDGAPGVYSARFAGKDCSFADNNRKLIGLLDGEANRRAQFRTVIHLIWKGQHHAFKGIVQGNISTDYRGNDGFGYDPIFIPDGFDQTFAEMTLEQKNQISHRAKAVEQLMQFLASQGV